MVRDKKAWVQVLGVTPKGCCWENFKKIRDLWGTLISTGKSIPRTDSFESMEMVIVTSTFDRIEEEIFLSVEDAGHRVIVEEIRSTIQAIPNNNPYLILRHLKIRTPMVMFLVLRTYKMIRQRLVSCSY